MTTVRLSNKEHDISTKRDTRYIEQKTDSDIWKKNGMATKYFENKEDLWVSWDQNLENNWNKNESPLLSMSGFSFLCLNEQSRDRSKKCTGAMQSMFRENWFDRFYLKKAYQYDNFWHDVRGDAILVKITSDNQCDKIYTTDHLTQLFLSFIYGFKISRRYWSRLLK